MLNYHKLKALLLMLLPLVAAAQNDKAVIDKVVATVGALKR